MKAIQVVQETESREMHVKIIEDRCILDGKCISVCPQNAKQPRSDVKTIEMMLARGHKVAATVAPVSYTHLTKRLIRTLKSRGYTRVAIHDPLAGNIEPDDAISLETRVQAEKALDQAVCKLLAGQTPDMKAVAHAIDAIIFDLRENSRLCMGIYSVRSYDHNTYTHSINVCILSISIADSLGWPLAKLRVLGTGRCV